MKPFKAWIISHPFKFAALFLCSLVSGAVMAGDLAFGLMLVALVYGMWALVYFLDTRLVIVALVASLTAVPVRAQEFKPAAGYVLGGIVVIVGAGLGWIGCKAVKACKKISRRNSGTNALAERFVVAGGDEYGAAIFWREADYCHEERLLPAVPVSFVLNIVVESESNATVTVSANTGFEFIQSWAEFTEEITGHGLTAATGPSFSRNGRPAAAHDVPVSFNPTNHVVTIGAGGVLVTIERSADLREWTTLMALDVEARGRPLRVEDASSGACFYRVTTKETP